MKNATWIEDNIKVVTQFPCFFGTLCTFALKNTHHSVECLSFSFVLLNMEDLNDLYISEIVRDAFLFTKGGPFLSTKHPERSEECFVNKIGPSLVNQSRLINFPDFSPKNSQIGSIFYFFFLLQEKMRVEHIAVAFILLGIGYIISTLGMFFLLFSNWVLLF